MADLAPQWFKDFRAWQGPYKRFKRWYENEVSKAMRKGENYTPLFWLSLLFIPAAIYIPLRLIETIYEAIFERKFKKFGQMYHAIFPGILMPLIGGFVFGFICFNVLTLGIPVGLVASYVGSFEAGMTAIAMAAPSVIGCLGAWFVHAKYEAMRENLETYGTSNPQKYGTEKEFFDKYKANLHAQPASETQPLLTNTHAQPALTQDQEHDRAFKIIARRTYAMYKWQGSPAWTYNLSQTQTNRHNEAEESVVNEDTINTTTNYAIDMKEIVQAVENNTATVGQKRAILHFYQNQHPQAYINVNFNRISPYRAFGFQGSEVKNITTDNIQALNNSLGNS